MSFLTFPEVCFHFITLIYVIFSFSCRASLYAYLSIPLVTILITAVDPLTLSHLLGLKYLQYLHHHSALNQYLGAITFSMFVEVRQKFCRACPLWQWAQPRRQRLKTILEINYRGVILQTCKQLWNPGRRRNKQWRMKGTQIDKVSILGSIW